MAANVSRSPSPVVAPPIEASPGPRAAKLIKLYEEAISHTVNACNYQNFAACFPTTAQNVPDALADFHKNFIDHLNAAFTREFEATLAARKVIPALNDLDRLVEEARKRKAKAEASSNGGSVTAPTPPHSLPARSLYLAHLNPNLVTKQHDVEARIEKVQVDNAKLAETIARQHADMNKIVGSIEAVVADLDNSLQALPTEQVQSLTRDAVELDVQMRTDD